jgi:hypothetical protein
MNNKVRYYIDSNNEFVIENYNIAGAFSNFLPGIAGLFGIPMWVFYVNRGQGICSFGINSKDSSIMEFLPANRAYQLVPSQGFRTFLKIKKGKGKIFYEPFKSYAGQSSAVITQRMFISSYELRLEEVNSTLGLKTEVVYFTIPNQPFAGLARIVTVENISSRDVSIDMLDGTPLIVPFETSNFFLQKMRRTIEAWMFVENLEHKAPFYRLKVDPKDISEVRFIEEGNFYIASYPAADQDRVLNVVVDPEMIFGQITDFSYPVNFVNAGVFKVTRNQMNQNRLPSAMAHTALELKKGKTFTLYSLLGHMSSKERLNSFIPELTREQFFISKREENRNIIKGLQDNIFTVSSDRKYDTYCGQTFLDNVMRGGFPITCPNNHTYAFYAYSRKHGDLERDYNKFSIEPAYFSQGHGNFRDTNQNRRNDIFFNPDINDFNVLYFYNLIQADGYNPLTLKGVRFKLKNTDYLKNSLKGKINETDLEKLKSILSIEITPGKLFMEIENHSIKLRLPWHEVLGILSKSCIISYDAEHGEGYWIDHWTYNLDIVESFLSIYPDKLKEILLDKKEFTFYDNVFCVKPRSERYLLKRDGTVRQYHSLEHDAKKAHLIKHRKNDPHLVRLKSGEGEIFKTTLLVKMLCLVVNKVSSFDASGIGIEMEADRPGWCDSMNGLPGLCGSSTPEAFELKRQLVFILNSLNRLQIEDNDRFDMPEEMFDFFKNIEALVKEKKDDFYYWDRSSSFKEEYREKVKFGFNGTHKALSITELKQALNTFILKVDSAIKKAYDPKSKLYSTYFINEVTNYKPLDRTDPIKGLPLVRPTEFKSIRLPLFLEGVVRAMKIEAEDARLLYKKVKVSPLYDKKLKMYKINGPLKAVSLEIGRSSIFTPGWLENESIWLHMEYKYLVEILKAGLYEEFFEELKNVLIPFQNPQRYRRSIFENSSFIVSSAFPDNKMHGRGFVARLSGSTAEMLNIWTLMNAGKTPFFVDEKGRLCLRLKPILPSWLFTKRPQCGFPKNTYAFRFLGKVLVVYHNPKMKATAGKNSVTVMSISMEYEDGRRIDIKSDVINPPYSLDIRDRKIKRIDVDLG